MLKKYLLVLVLFCLAASVSFSDGNPAEMTDLEILTELTENLKLREKLQDEREIALNQREIRLEQNESDFERRMTSWTAMENFSQNLREEQKQSQSEAFWKGFGLGFSTGFLVGGASGFTVGVKLPY